jgi:hypothetical protein
VLERYRDMLRRHSTWYLSAGAIVCAALLVGIWMFSTSLAVALFGFLLAAGMQVMDKGSSRQKRFWAIVGVAVTFLGAVVGYWSTQQANAESEKFQTAVKTAQRDLAAKTDEVSGLTREVLELSRQNTSLSRSIVDLSRAIAFPLQAAIRADVVIDIDGGQAAVSAWSKQLHQRAFPNGRQAMGYILLPAIDPRVEDQAPLARFVSSLILSFVFCPKSNCGFSQRAFYPKAMDGVESLASAPLGPEISPLLDGHSPLILGKDVQLRYDANRDRFEIFIHSEPLQFWLPTDAVQNSGELPLKYVFFEGPVSSEIQCSVTRLALGRSDNRWLPAERLQSIERAGMLYYWGRLKSRWM